MSCAFPIAKQVPQDLNERAGEVGTEKEVAVMEELVEEGLGKQTAAKRGDTTNGTAEEGADQIGISKGTAQNLCLLNMPLPGKSPSKSNPAQVKALATLDKNRHSSGARKGVSTYNVKALAGTAIHTPRKFNKDENGGVKSASSKGKDGSVGTIGKPSATVRGPSTLGKIVPSIADHPPPSTDARSTASNAGKPGDSTAIPSLAPPPRGMISNSKKSNQSSTSLPPPSASSLSATSKTGKLNPAISIASQIPIPVGVSSNLGKPSRSSIAFSLTSAVLLSTTSNTSKSGASVTVTSPPAGATSIPAKQGLSGTTAFLMPSQPIKNIIKNPFFRIKLVVKPKPAVHSDPIQRVSSRSSVALGASGNTTTGTAQVSKQPSVVKVANLQPDGKISQTFGGSQRSSQASNPKVNGGGGTKRAAPVDVDTAEPVAKKRKTNAVSVSTSNNNVLLCLNNTCSESTPHCLLKDKQIITNSAVLKHVLESKANLMENYDSDDDLCYDPSTSKKGRLSNTRSIFILPLLNAMLQELDEELPNLDTWDKENREYLQTLLTTPSAKIWDLVKVWQCWVETGKVELGRCPFQRERMLKFARVMETPVEFFRAVKKHELDEKRFPTEKEVEMWNAGLHPEQWIDKEDKERGKYWSYVGGHIHEYYAKRGL